MNKSLTISYATNIEQSADMVWTSSARDDWKGLFNEFHLLPMKS